MKISYNYNSITYGQLITKEEANTEPNVEYTAYPDTLYTLLIYDPDAVTDTHNFIHWLVVNINGEKIDEGKHLLSYTGPNPPPNSGLHHYKFELFTQPAVIPIDDSIERTIPMSELYKKLNLTKENKRDSFLFKVQSQTGGRKRKTKKRKYKTKYRFTKKDRLHKKNYFTNKKLILFKRKK
uniref:Large ribosomal subunit protein mL38 n=1 Tax=viral metagenome TaxID=1070528 RepID=A0A6C0KUL8_9ZZZZ